MKEAKIINYVVTEEKTVEFSVLGEEQKREITKALYLVLSYRFLEKSEIKGKNKKADNGNRTRLSSLGS